MGLIDSRHQASEPASGGGGAQLWHQLRSLHPLEGAALLLVVGFQVSPETVGRTLGVPEQRVSSLCDQGIRKLRDR